MKAFGHLTKALLQCSTNLATPLRPRAIAEVVGEGRVFGWTNHCRATGCANSWPKPTAAAQRQHGGEWLWLFTRHWLAALMLERRSHVVGEAIFQGFGGVCLAPVSGFELLAVCVGLDEGYDSRPSKTQSHPRPIHEIGFVRRIQSWSGEIPDRVGQGCLRGGFNFGRVSRIGCARAVRF